MEIIISAIVGWITSNILNKIFKREKKNEEIIKLRSELLKQLEERERQIIKLNDEQREEIKEKKRIIDSIKRSGLSTEKLINRYGKSLNAILISCYNQKTPDSTIYGTSEKFLLKELERFNGKHLGSGVYLIPPASVPKNIQTRNELEEWFETEILKGRYCILKFLIVFDLRKKAYWNNYLLYEQTHKISRTLGDVLDVEDLFTEEQLKTTTIDHIIKGGDIGWLAYNYLSEGELRIIRENQNAIEKALGNPSLRLLSNESMIEKISSVLNNYSIANSIDIAKAIVSEAKFWQLKLLH